MRQLELPAGFCTFFLPKPGATGSAGGTLVMPTFWMMLFYALDAKLIATSRHLALI